MKRKYNCCICGKVYFGHGNNPFPVKNTGECCTNCKALEVIPERLLRLKLKECGAKNV